MLRPAPPIMNHVLTSSVLKPGEAGVTPASRFNPILPALLLLGILAVLYERIVWELVRQWWQDPNYSHGFLVPFFSGWLVWQQRATLLSLTSRGRWIGLPLLLGGIAMLVLGDLAAEFFLTRSSLLVILAGLIVFHLGTAALRLVAFPLAFLLFMMPLPTLLFNAVAFPLQGLAAENAAWLLEVFGVPVLRDGNIIHLSQMTMGVTEACSGIRSLMSLLCLATAWAYIALPGGWSALALVLSAVPITIVANAGRVVVTGLIGQWFGIRYAQGFFHTFSGWVIFLIAFVGLLAVYRVLQMVDARSRRKS